MSSFTVMARICECDHPESDHETAGRECAYGWTGEPGEEPCDCLEFRYRADLVAAPLRFVEATKQGARTRHRRKETA